MADRMERHGLRKTEFRCPRCGYTEVRYFPTRRRPSRNPVYCQHCPGTPTGTGVMMIAYWLEGFGSDPLNPLRHASVSMLAFFGRVGEGIAHV